MARTLKHQLCDALSELEHVVEGEGIFDDTERAFFVDGRLIAEFAGSNYIGLRLTWPVIRGIKAELAGDRRVDHPIKSGTDWIHVHFRRAGDLPFIVELVAPAITAYLPADARALRPPPAGHDLARRRRFH